MEVLFQTDTDTMVTMPFPHLVLCCPFYILQATVYVHEKCLDDQHHPFYACPKPVRLQNKFLSQNSRIRGTTILRLERTLEFLVSAHGPVCR